MPPCRSPTALHLGQVDADGDQRLGDLRRQAGDDDAGAHEARRLDRLHEVVGDVGVDRRHAGDVDDDHLGAVGADAAQQLLGELARALRVDDADDRQDEQAARGPGAPASTARGSLPAAGG